MALKRIMATSLSNNPLRTVVAVIGTTGVGKSNLAVALAESLKSRRSEAVVLSADSMQIYKGLDVITNKITKDEMRGVRHWGLDMVKPGEGNWEMGRWCLEADREISKMPEGTLPIICGGTHYFIQHFLFPPGELSFEREQDVQRSKRWTPPHPRPEVPGIDKELGLLLDTFWTEQPIWPGSQASSSTPTAETQDQLLSLHHLLSAVDPKEAGRWHWRDGRKVRRGLERWWENSGRSNVGNGEKGEGRRARFRTIIFWVYEPLESLRPRLGRRVDKMVKNGLLNEIAELRSIANEIYGEGGDHTEGIFQSIGYKEFSDLNLKQENPSSDPTFGPMLERMKLSTHQYARSQIKWIKKQLLPAVKEAKSLGGDVQIYVVRGGQEGYAPSIELLHNFLDGQEMPLTSTVGHPDAGDLMSEFSTHDTSLLPDTSERQTINQRLDCEICSTPHKPYSVTKKEWQTHIRSKPHKIKQNLLEVGGRDKWIELQKAKGAQKKSERDAEKVGVDSRAGVSSEERG